MSALRSLSRPWILLLALGACGGDSETTDEAATEAQYGGTVVIANNSDLTDLNPLVAGEKYSQEVNRFMLFVPLVRHAKDLSFEPALAESWEMLGDTGVVFHLRRDVRWHDGMPTTARDVVFTYERIKDPETIFPNPEYFQLWTDVEATDSFTVRFSFEPHMDPLAGWAFAPIAPAHLLDSIPSSRMLQASFNRAPVGNGPFRFVEYRQNDRWIFEANPEFPEALGGRPYLDRVVWRPIPDGNAQITELRTGGADIVLTPIAEQFVATRDMPGFRGLNKNSRQYASAIWNGRVPPLDDPQVRLALGLAINRQQIIDVLRAGFGAQAVGPIGPSHWAYDASIEPLPYAPDSARALLSAAGIEDRNGDGTLELPGGEPFEIELKIPAGSVTNRDMAELIRADLARIGVQVDTRSTDWGTMIEDFTSPERRFEAILLGVQTDFRINLYDTFHSGALGTPNQISSYSNPRVGSLIDRARLAQSMEEAKPLYAEIQRILRDEQPWSFLYYYPDLVLMSDRLQGVEMDDRGNLVSIQDWWVTDARSAPAQSDSAVRSQPRDSAPAQ
ncbi:MAG TPA: ABC transporter substrate-binding protein [Longimicrobiales bacterium]|nr:ABC transporter substrate-binding protein [Longimicrobiales bacterium]